MGESKAIEAIVSLQGVGKHYGVAATRIDALLDVELEISRGEFVVLSGPSGSGKTTLLNIIGLLDEPSQGAVVLEGRPVTGVSRTTQARLRRDRLGFVFQAYNLIPVLTVLENAEFVLALQRRPREERRTKARWALAEVGLLELQDRFPHQLSGGQQQRVAIARALAPSPALILADEPTANLDSRAASALLDTMEELNRRQHTTFVLSTHDARVVERVRRIVKLVDGRITETL